MPTKPHKVHTLKTYWKRERDFQRRQPLIDGRVILSLDVPGAINAPNIRRTRTHSAAWERCQIEKAIARLPKSLKRYSKVLWAIYYHLGDRQQIIAASGLSVRHYYRVREKFLKFFSANVSAGQTPIELL